MQNLNQLALHQIVALHQKHPEHRAKLEREWLGRCGLPYPYRLNAQNILMNDELDRPAYNPPQEVQERAAIMKLQQELREQGQTEIFDYI
ncbi:hypothetical protein [Sediminibacillus massiliensis]|uniref:hypothetical protein n=1 Tax=Sediminibacillus massiliensis TaxID=1926277 RepID=UPI0009888C4D|nr:hypothetical protein [Sediminibacillus massiliensis]